MISSATHRMGSTLTQRIFNARPKTLIWGENGGALTNFLDIYKNIILWSNYATTSGERDNYFNSNENPNTWIANIIPELDYSEKVVFGSVRSFYNNLYNSDKHDFIGFKEVRYGKDEIELFKKCYPNAMVILLIRNPIDTYRSLINVNRDWYQTVENYMSIWNKRIEEYIKLSETYKDMYLLALGVETVRPA
jgi:hypothetical protein